jgi:hypothetical protein
MAAWSMAICVSKAARRLGLTDVPVAIAAETVGRVCVAMELDPAYCDVIVERWQAFTGKKAVRDADKCG